MTLLATGGRRDVLTCCFWQLRAFTIFYLLLEGMDAQVFDAGTHVMKDFELALTTAKAWVLCCEDSY